MSIEWVRKRNRFRVRAGSGKRNRVISLGYTKTRAGAERIFLRWHLRTYGFAPRHPWQAWAGAQLSKVASESAQYGIGHWYKWATRRGWMLSQRHVVKQKAVKEPPAPEDWISAAIRMLDTRRASSYSHQVSKWKKWANRKASSLSRRHEVSGRAPSETDRVAGLQLRPHRNHASA